MKVYYNEIDLYCAEWLKNLMGAELIPHGDVDTRSIVEVQADDLRGYDQCHFFAGIAGWSQALKLAMWPDDRPVWTGSCPCQPFSSAGKQQGNSDARHLWPVWFNLISKCKPSVIFGEQVANAVAHGWFDEVANDLEAEDYAVAAAVIPACGAEAFHRRERLWFVADADGARPHAGAHGRIYQGEESPRTRDVQFERCGLSSLVNAESNGKQWLSEKGGSLVDDLNGRGGGDEISWIEAADGKARPIKPGLCLLADGVPARVGKLRAFGNAIDPRPASKFIQAYRECVT